MLYTGEQFDTDLQHYYLRARYYDPSNGRFNRLDPFAGNNFDPQSLHKYAFGHQDPVNSIDPSGNQELLLELLSTLPTRFYIWLAGATRAAMAFRYALSVLNLIAFFYDPEAYISVGPGGAAEAIAIDIVQLYRAGQGLFRSARAAWATKDAFKTLSGFRKDMSIPQLGEPGGDDTTTALLEIHDKAWIGSRFKGKSPHNPSNLNEGLVANAITRQHAEADAFSQAANSGITADEATLYVDRPLCQACGKFGGVKSMAKSLAGC